MHAHMVKRSSWVWQEICQHGAEIFLHPYA